MAIILPIDELIFFKMVISPPTSHILSSFQLFLRHENHLRSSPPGGGWKADHRAGRLHSEIQKEASGPKVAEKSPTKWFNGGLTINKYGFDEIEWEYK